VERKDKRRPDELRKVRLTRGVSKFAEGSALIEVGDTRVICTASVENRVPSFLKDTSKGWITAEYALLPRSTPTRSAREASRGKLSGRTQEIQRLIGRSLRAVADLEALSGRTFWMDCDVLQADGGTRAAAITGAYVALHQASRRLCEQGELERFPLREFVAAASAGVVDGRVLLDLSYEEDVEAAVDMNLVLTSADRIVEVQATAEGGTFSQNRLQELIRVAKKGVADLINIQRTALGET